MNLINYGFSEDIYLKQYDKNHKIEYINKAHTLRAKYIIITQDIYNGCGNDSKKYITYVCSDDKKEKIVSECKKHPSITVIEIINVDN